MVNGQTGKVVGTVPFSKCKVAAMFAFFAGIFSTASTYVGSKLLQVSLDGNGIIQYGPMLLICIVMFFVFGFRMFARFIRNQKITMDESMKDFVDR